VLIDEVDKAPRDFPNDLLNELDQTYFRIPELGEVLTPKEGLAPIVIITSNSEKNLPEPFLRRCVYHHISFPTDPKEIQQIINARVTNMAKKPKLAKQLLSIFETSRNEEMISKKPSISEAIVWMDALLKIYDEVPDKPLKRAQLGPYWGILFKKQDDLAYAIKNLPAEPK
jgi:MoxR-like ATPase